MKKVFIAMLFAAAFFVGCQKQEAAAPEAPAAPTDTTAPAAGTDQPAAPVAPEAPATK